MTAKQDTRSLLAKARGLGATGGGLEHWLSQRLTALALIFLLPWFIISVVPVMFNSDAVALSLWLESWDHALLLIAFTLLALWHGKLGLQVVVEDYIHHSFLRVLLLFSLIFAWLGLSGFAIVLIYAL